MTPADRPTITDDARAEAERRWPESARWQSAQMQVEEFVAGAEWAAARAEPEPAPAWPTAPHVWWDGELFLLMDPGTGFYGSATRVRDNVGASDHRFAREAIPVTLVPTAEWEAWRSGARWLLAREALGGGGDE